MAVSLGGKNADGQVEDEEDVERGRVDVAVGVGVTVGQSRCLLFSVHALVFGTGVPVDGLTGTVDETLFTVGLLEVVTHPPEDAEAGVEGVEEQVDCGKGDVGGEGISVVIEDGLESTLSVVVVPHGDEDGVVDGVRGENVEDAANVEELLLGIVVLEGEKLAFKVRHWWLRW
jgi:hypothetical protein